MSSLKAEDFIERSPLYPLHHGARLAALGSSAIVARYGEQEEHAQLQSCALIDLSNLPRAGFRGLDAAAYLQARGYVLPGAPNRSQRQDDGTLVARLSQTEYLLLGSLHDMGARIAAEEAAWQLGDSGNYLLPRQDSHAWLQLSGAHYAQVMAKLCGVDLHPQAFGPGAVAQTSAARINVIVINSGSAELPCLQILCDRASVEYFWTAMLDAMDEFDGRPVGIDALID
ncbi:sarcosine oxidase [Pseudomonas nitroreducens]|uniref:sarcosine oxidase subunit gamma n=1 Tax=Pseudomonas TaxID=286 RepID=UPI0009F593DF|nr:MULTISPECIES: sarcosine oxidase [Pseudomonas]MDG9856831.1 sarcosine oxidase [Pseudomonas nitroreducens]MDH1072888.1 sarcosine oxidase [Pseudomonas nitroreducens]NMZ72228.1 sarcosine oxidase [Pseudomonas nitroreducens]RUE86433.1 sarcosine oxidase [Pseudomonas aeruginosa]